MVGREVGYKGMNWEKARMWYLVTSRPYSTAGQVLGKNSSGNNNDTN